MPAADPPGYIVVIGPSTNGPVRIMPSWHPRKSLKWYRRKAQWAKLLRIEPLRRRPHQAVLALLYLRLQHIPRRGKLLAMNADRAAAEIRAAIQKLPQTEPPPNMPASKNLPKTRSTRSQLKAR